MDFIEAFITLGFYFLAIIILGCLVAIVDVYVYPEPTCNCAHIRAQERLTTGVTK